MFICTCLSVILLFELWMQCCECNWNKLCNILKCPYYCILLKLYGNCLHFRETHTKELRLFPQIHFSAKYNFSIIIYREQQNRKICKNRNQMIFVFVQAGWRNLQDATESTAIARYFSEVCSILPLANQQWNLERLASINSM